MSEASGHYRLYHYWRSSSSWRVRFALHLKGIPYEPVPVSLLDGSAEAPEHRERNPAGFVPVLEIGAGNQRLTESLAILLYLEARHSELPALLPDDPYLKGRCWALAETINAGIQPIQNLPVLYRHSDDPEEQKQWARHFIRQGLEVYESLCAPVRGLFSVGNQPTVADLCLSPQLYNADRYGVDWSDLRHLVEIEQACRGLPAWAESHPDRFKPHDFKG
jgi:maleylacetoacetate isomerase